MELRLEAAGGGAAQRRAVAGDGNATAVVVQGGYRAVELVLGCLLAYEEVDIVDEYFNTILLRNIGIRGVPGPVVSPICGTVITISLTGTLTVPFLVGPGVVGNDPSYDQDDEPTVAAIGGQYDFVVSTL